MWILFHDRCCAQQFGQHHSEVSVNDDNIQVIMSRYERHRGPHKLNYHSVPVGA